ncbi:MAG: hypothetical protein KJO15_12575 [Alphaproteobacteria bacterium]|nr:hypothetical protein [Alphaproteobacteria bacterium]
MAFEFSFEDETRSLLQSFLKQLQQIMNSIVYEGYLFKHEVRLHDEPREYLIPVFESELPEAFSRTETAIFEASDEALSRHGLSGAALQSKLRLLQFLGRRFIDGLVDTLRFLLVQINSLLGSIQNATGWGDFIKEIKDAIENSIDYVRRA